MARQRGGGRRRRAIRDRKAWQPPVWLPRDDSYQRRDIYSDPPVHPYARHIAGPLCTPECDLLPLDELRDG